MMLTDQELQSLRNLGNQCEEAASEIYSLRAALENTRAEALLAVSAAQAAERQRYAPLMQAVEWLLNDGHMSQEHLARLRAAHEQA